MALILHLTDLHLGLRPEDQILDDYKSDIIPLSERSSRTGLLRSTLRALAEYLRDRRQRLDALVVSGDITVANDPDGFRMFNSILEELGDALPLPGNILVVPGNHDVAWGTAPGSAERYQNFIQYIRASGYISPVLDGIDIGPVKPKIDPGKHSIVLDDGRVQLIGLNSSNYCGSMEPLKAISEDEWRRIPTLLKSSDVRGAERDLRQLRLQDVARISHAQLSALSDILRSGHRRVADEVGSVRVAVLHHHLFPVSTVEEFKAYEAITNLGLLRMFLRANHFDLVIHGHKHMDAAYWDDMQVYGNAPINIKPGRMLVLGGSTLDGMDTRRSQVCRLIRIDTATTAPETTLYSVPATDPGGRLDDLRSRRFALWDIGNVLSRRTDATKTVRGGSLDHLYDQLIGLFANYPQHLPINNLVCEIDSVGAGLTLPSNYPVVPGKTGADRQQWFEELVRWWQRKKTALGGRVSFTHGERIYNYGTGKVNQVGDVVRALKEKRSTSRAVITLLDPRIDGRTQRKAPHFCLLQFLIAERDGRLVLNCVAYFRKQEIRYWWPVNVAEIALMRDEVLGQLGGAYRQLVRGSITTVASIAYASTSCPKVAIPFVDRLLDEDSDLLWQLAYSLVWAEIPKREALRADWDRILADLIPDEKPDPDGVPVATVGLDNLLSEIKRFARFHHTTKIGQIHRNLTQLLRENRAYADQSEVATPSAERHAEWRNACVELVGQVRVLVAECWNG